MEIEIEGSQGTILGYLSQSTSKTKQKGQASQIMVMNFGLPIARPLASTDLFHRDLVERVANQSGWTVLSVLGSGIDGSSGRFSPMNWCDDMNSVARYLVANFQAKSILLAGYDIAAAICLYVAAKSDLVRGVVSISPVIDLSGYMADPHLLAGRARAVGVKVTTKESEIVGWSKELEELDPSRSAEAIGSKEWLVIHGRDDEVVTDSLLKDFLGIHGVSAEVHILTAGDHQLTTDPRMMAILLGWMERIH